MVAVKHNHWLSVARSYIADGLSLIFAFLAGTIIRFGPEWTQEGLDFPQMAVQSAELSGNASGSFVLSSICLCVWTIQSSEFPCGNHSEIPHAGSLSAANILGVISFFLPELLH